MVILHHFFSFLRNLWIKGSLETRNKRLLCIEENAPLMAGLLCNATGLLAGRKKALSRLAGAPAYLVGTCQWETKSVPVMGK
jgi:hypothetical protein